MVVSVLLKIKFGHTQVSVPKIGILMSETACINPSMKRCLVINKMQSLISNPFESIKLFVLRQVVYKLAESS